VFTLHRQPRSQQCNTALPAHGKTTLLPLLATAGFGEASSLAITHAESESTNIQRWGSFMSVSACGCKQLQAMTTELIFQQQAMQCNEPGCWCSMTCYIVCMTPSSGSASLLVVIASVQKHLQFEIPVQNGSLSFDVSIGHIKAEGFHSALAFQIADAFGLKLSPPASS